jgi:hypothetical protein
MPPSDPIVYGTVTVGAVTVRAMVRTREGGRRREWKSITALRWQTLPPTAVFTPDAIQPREAATVNAVRQ